MGQLLRRRGMQVVRPLNLHSLRRRNICRLQDQGQRRGWPTCVLFLNLFLLVNGDPRPNLPFIGCAAPEGNRQRCYFYVQEKKTWDEADKACRSNKGAYLATIPDYQTRIFLSAAARPRQNGVWIGGKKEPQHNWRWNTARPYLHKVIVNRTEPDAELCGYVNAPNSSVIQTAPCINKLKYICSESEMRSINDPHYVSPWKHKWTWFSAKIDCMNRGMDLAMVKEDNLDIFRQLLELETQIEENPRYWVGLSASRYKWKHNGKEMVNMLFSCGEPSHSSEHCLEMLDDGKYSDTLCEEKRPYICEWVKEGHAMFDIGCLGTHCFYYVEEPMNWNDANGTCRQYTDTFLATIPDYHTQFYLNSKVTELFLTKREDQSVIMGRTNVIENGFWIGGHTIFYDKWKFMNGDQYQGDVDIEDPFKDYHCGAIIPKDNAVHGLPCDYQRRFLCLTTDPDADVLREENHFISSAQTQVMDWFKARINCLDRGMELASCSMELLQQILTGETGSFWVGLTRSRYVWERTRKPLDHLTFRCGEPNNNKGFGEHCVEMWLDGEYNDGLCSKHKPFVCEWDRAPVSPSTTKVPYFTSKPAECKTNIFVSVAIVGYIGWVMAIFLALYVRMYGKNSHTLKKLTELTGDNAALQKKLSGLEEPPSSDYKVTLENENDPNLNNLLSDDLRQKLVNAAPSIHEYLPLSTSQKLWNILLANEVVDRETMESIRGNDNRRTNTEQVSGLIEHLRRGPNRRYFYFRECLLLASYDYVVRHYFDHAPGSPQSTTMPTTPHGRCAQCAGAAFTFPPTTHAMSAIQGGKEDQSSTTETATLQLQQTSPEPKVDAKASLQFPSPEPTLSEEQSSLVEYFQDKYQPSTLNNDVTANLPHSPTDLALPETRNVKDVRPYSPSPKDAAAFKIQGNDPIPEIVEDYPCSVIVSDKTHEQPDSVSFSAFNNFGRTWRRLLSDLSKYHMKKSEDNISCIAHSMDTDTQA